VTALGTPPSGKHVYANLYDVDPGVLADERRLAELVAEVAREGGVEVVEIKSWSFGGRKGGVSVVAVLAGAHMVIHTWVEYRYATLDILVTGDADPTKLFEKIVSVLKPRSYRFGFTYRGPQGGELPTQP
jgi:S-adenosylmethionine decarboxylase